VLLEQVQHRLTRMFSHLRHLDYFTRLDMSGLWSLEKRRNRADLLEVFKIMRGHTSICVDRGVDSLFEPSKDIRTRGYSLKFAKHRTDKDKLSWDVTTTYVNSALHPSGVAKSSTSFGWGKGGKVTAAGRQVTLCDPIWHVISRSGVVISITNCYIRVYFTLLKDLRHYFFSERVVNRWNHAAGRGYCRSINLELIQEPLDEIA